MNIRIIINQLINKFFAYKKYELLCNVIKKHNVKTYVEVGVFNAVNLINVYKNSNLTKVYGVDNYINNDDWQTIEELNKIKIEAIDRMKKNGIIFYENSSLDASKLFDDKSIDMIFIDADHSYKGCKEDIEVWYPKIRDGGIISGHNFELKYLGVVQAVTEKFLNINLLPKNIWYVKKGVFTPPND